MQRPKGLQRKSSRKLSIDWQPPQTHTLLHTDDFEASGILPVLKPVFETADGELLLALVRNAGVFQRLMRG